MNDTSPRINLRKFTAEQRTRALEHYFGPPYFPLGELSILTGLTVDQITKDCSYFNLNGGFSAIRTCGRSFRVGVLAPNHQGDFAFWASAILGYWATGPLSPAESERTRTGS